MKANNHQNKPETFAFASLSKYPLKKKILVYLIDFSLYLLTYFIGKTVNFDTSHREESKSRGWEYMQQFTADKPVCIAVFWHNQILLTSYFWRFSNFVAMVSGSFDGEYISRTLQRLKIGVIRGSSTRGGTQALRRMIRILRKEKSSITFAIDGPKGPIYKVKPGAVLLAKTSGVPIVPLVIEPQSFWTVNSWDKMQIPKPFTKAKVLIAEPIFVSKDAGVQELEDKRREIQQQLDELTSIGEQWRNINN